MSSKGCVLAGLADPRLGGALPGLTITTHEIKMAPSNFLCCDGTGVRLETAHNVSARCDLRKRIAAVASLVLQFRKTWGPEEKLPLAMAGKDVTDLAKRVHPDAFRDAKGRSVARNARAKGPSPL